MDISIENEILHDKKTNPFLMKISPWTLSRASCSLYHSLCIIKAIDIQQVYVWGKNQNNVLGLGFKVTEQVFPCPMEYFLRNNIMEVSCGINHTMILVKDNPRATGGKLFATGLGNRGRLGFNKGGNEDESTDSWFTPEPTRVKFPNKTRIIRVACGADHTLAITKLGELYAWGINQYGNLGLGHQRDEFFPVQVMFPTNSEIIHCAAGSKHSIACNLMGQCFTWGHNGSGRLGLGHTRASFSPTHVADISGIHFVSAGEAHTACIDNNGVLFTWGSGASGRLGHGDDYDMSVPRKVEEFTNTKIVLVSCGTFHNLAINEKGELFGWGSGLGVGFTSENENITTYIPKKLDFEKFGAVICFAKAGVYHSIAINIMGDVFCWGISGHSRLGHGNDFNYPFPEYLVELRNRAYVNDLKNFFGARQHKEKRLQLRAMNDLKPWHVVKVQCGEFHTMILTKNGSVWLWGSNSHGQLGLGDSALTISTNTPTCLDVFKEPIRSIACGSLHSLAANVYGQLFVWGCGQDGQLGLGRIVNCLEPVGVETIKGVFLVEARENYSACLAVSQFELNREEQITAEAGDLWTWGGGETGKLGHKGILSGHVLAPKKVQISTIISKIACGKSHMVVCNPLGAVFTWGAGYYGRLGIGANINSDVPLEVTIPDAEFIIDVAAGDFHSLALSETGSIFAWGRNICVSSENHINEPQLFNKIYNEKGPAKCKAIYAANEHSFAVTLLDQLYAWGNNKQKQLGVENKKFDYIGMPEIVPLNDSVEIIGTSENFTIAIMKRGAALSWGRTDEGCLGCGEIEKRIAYTPVAVKPAWMKHDLKELEQMAQENPAATNVSNAFQSIEEKTALFMETLKSATDVFPVSSIQSLLKAEPAMYQIEHIRYLEDDLIKIYERFLHNISSIPEVEAEYRMLQTSIKHKYTRVIVGFNCQKAKSSNTEQENEALKYYLSQIQLIQQIIYCLQLQPTYFYTLLCITDHPKELQILLESIKTLYCRIEDVHVNAAFLGILAALCTYEVEKATDLVHLFDPSHSSFINLLSVYATINENLKHYGATLVDLNSTFGCSHILSQLDSSILCLEPKQLETILKASGKNSADINQEFKESVDKLRIVLSALPNSLNFPPNICALIKHAYDIISEKTCVFDNGSSKYLRTTYNQIYPIIRLILQGIVARLWKTPKVYADAIMGLQLSQIPAAEINFRTLWLYINSAFQENFMTYEYGHIFRDIFQRIYYPLSTTIVELCDTVPDGYLSVQGTLCMFAVHFQESDYFVTLRSDYTANLINILKRHEGKLQLSAYDPVAEAMRKLNPSTNFVFSPEIIAELEKEPYMHNLYIDRRFYIKTQSAVVDSITNMIIPQNLAYRQQAAIIEGKKVIAFLRRFNPPNSFDPYFIIEQCIRDLPLLKAKSWDHFKKELEIVHSYYLKQKTPQYQKAELMQRSINAVENLENQGITLMDFYLKVIQSMVLRQKHVKYLKLIQGADSTVAEWERLYRANLNEQCSVLSRTFQNLREFNIEDIIRQKLMEANLRPEVDNLSKMLISEDNYFSTHITCPLSQLLQTNVIISHVIDKNSINLISLTFSGNKDGSWEIQIIENNKSNQRRLDLFNISFDDLKNIQNLPGWLPISFGEKFVTFQSNSLLQFIYRESVY